MSLASGCPAGGASPAMGLCTISRRHVRAGKWHGCGTLFCWRFRLRSMGLLALVFLVLELLWDAHRWLVFAVFLQGFSLPRRSCRRFSLTAGVHCCL